MRQSCRRVRAFTLPEMTMAVSIGFVVAIIGWAMMIFAWRQIYVNRLQTTAQMAAYGVVQVIAEDVMRASIIEVPDPDYPSVPSIQVRIPSGITTLRRAYRLVSGNVLSQYKDEGVAAYTIYDNVQALTFTYVTASTNPAQSLPAKSAVEISCTVAGAGQNIQVTSTAAARNFK